MFDVHEYAAQPNLMHRCVRSYARPAEHRRFAYSKMENMYDVSEDETDADFWSGEDIEEYAPKSADDDYVDGLVRQIFSLLDGAFPGQVQCADVVFQPGNFAIHEDFESESAEREFAEKVFPTLKQEIIRQAESLGSVWSARFDVAGSTSRQRGATVEPHASVSVLVVEGPVDPDIS